MRVVKDYTLKYIQKIGAFDIYERHSVSNVKYLVVNPIKKQLFGVRLSFKFLHSNDRKNIRFFLLDSLPDAQKLAKQLTPEKNRKRR